MPPRSRMFRWQTRRTWLHVHACVLSVRSDCMHLAMFHSTSPASQRCTTETGPRGSSPDDDPTFILIGIFSRQAPILFNFREPGETTFSSFCYRSHGTRTNTTSGIHKADNR